MKLTGSTSIWCLMILVACGDDGGGRHADTTVADTTVADTNVADTNIADTTVADTTVTDTTVADTTVADTTVADTGEPPPPNISVALDCGAGPPDGPGNSNELQRAPIDLAKFPDALCNDGSGAVFYFRPYQGEENKNRWLINLNGGGACSGGQSCADRWCWCRSNDGPNGCPFANGTTNFSMANMNTNRGASLKGDGIFLRGDAQRPNPIGNWNQVRIVYCSSDVWTGTRRDVPLEAVHPKTGEPVTYSIDFLGRRILDGTIATLRRDGVGAPRYTFGAATDMPDLDDATEVLFSGDSGGGAGVINNLDRLAADLRAHNSACGGADCPLRVSGLMDAIVGPELARLDFSTSVYADVGVTTYDQAMAYVASVPDKNLGRAADESCASWHAAHEPDTAARCSDESHIVRNHLTTPFFVRMALLDQLISANYIETKYSDPELGLLDLQKFAVILQRELAAFPEMQSSAEEGDDIVKAPGVFAPACSKHDTIHDNQSVFGVTVTPAGGEPMHLFDVLTRWSTGGTPTAVLTSKLDRSDTDCGGE